MNSRLNNQNSKTRGFTLLELLIVIGILAILATVTILTINPGELLKKSRDTKRIGDIAALNKALGVVQSLNPNVNMGSANIVYVSLPDNASTTCGSWGLPVLPSGWNYNCVNQTNLQKVNASGWVPVDFTSVAGMNSPIANLPLDPVNASSSQQYYTYITGGSWRLHAVFESSRYLEIARKDGGFSDFGYELGNNLALGSSVFPSGWIKVPSSPDFWVMKYEAKYDKDGNGFGDDAAAANCPADSGDGLDWRDSGCNTDLKVISTALGSPIVHITHNQAKSVCQTLGGHLITNQEWMNIARNAEQVGQNWSSGTVGTGCLFRGNVGSDDACGYNGADPEKGSTRNAKAKLILSNGAEIWDLAGNVWEHVMKDSSDTLVRYTPTDGGLAGWRWIEHTAITGYGDLSYDTIRPSNSSWNATHGMGRVYTYNGDYGTQTRVLLRGGDWLDGGGAGAFALSSDWGTGDLSTNVGFRCAR